MKGILTECGDINGSDFYWCMDDWVWGRCWNFIFTLFGIYFNYPSVQRKRMECVYSSLFYMVDTFRVCVINTWRHINGYFGKIYTDV